MAVTYNTTGKSITKIYRATGGGVVFSANLAATPVFDYFTDTAVVNDAIYFSPGNYYAFSDLLFNVGTAIAAGSITIVWEYYRINVGWVAIDHLQDDTNSFTTVGANVVRFPYQWNWRYTTINGSNHSWVRARISAVSSITEGGANQTTSVSSKDGCVDIDGYSDTSPCSFTVVSNYLEATYPHLGTIKTGQYFDFRFVGLNINSRLISTNEFIETHNGSSAGYTIGRVQKWYYLQLGTKVGTSSGKDGSVVYVNATANTYPFNVSSSFKMYGSTIRSPSDVAGYPALYGEYLDSDLELRPKLATSATMKNCRFVLGGGLIQSGGLPSVFDKNKFIIRSQLALVYQGGFTAVEMDYEFVSSGVMLYIYQTYSDVDWVFIDPQTPLPAQEASTYMIHRIIYTTADIARCFNYDNTDGFTDQTSEANSTALDDVNLTGKTGVPEVGDILYICLGTGSSLIAHSRLDITMGSVLNSDNEYEWEIYASGWKKALVWDGTENFTKTGKIWIGKRSDSGTYFTTTTINGVNGYYARARITSAGSSKPLISRIRGAGEHGVSRWHAYEKYHIGVKVVGLDSNGIENATVTIKSASGVQQFSVQTDANGDIAEQSPIITRKFFFDPVESYAKREQVKDESTPDYEIEIKKAGYQTYRTAFMLNKKTEWTIRLIHSNVNVDQEVL